MAAKDWESVWPNTQRRYFDDGMVTVYPVPTIFDTKVWRADVRFFSPNPQEGMRTFTEERDTELAAKRAGMKRLRQMYVEWCRQNRQKWLPPS